VFDRYEEVGGLLTFGIPPFKLDKAVMRLRRDVLEGMGVKFHLGVEVGRDIAFASLIDGYDAVFIGTGAYTAVDGDLPGQDQNGVYAALPFLVANAQRILGSTQDSQALPNVIGKRVVVLGGGDTAMDCVRTSIRMDAESVTCVYRRDEANMPGSRREVKYSRDEGVQFLFNRQPLAIVGDADGVQRVRFAQTRLVAGVGGRARPEIIAGSEQEIPADVVILSFGFLASPPAWCNEFGIDLHANGRIDNRGAQRLPLQTTHPKVFAGGDAVRGADLVVRAALDGREAAKSILRQLALVATTAAA
jgi:glutamate synthase (NADPH/NADH) small chain